MLNNKNNKKDDEDAEFNKLFLNYPDVLKKLKSNEASLIGYDSIQTQIIIKGFENYLMMGSDNKNGIMNNKRRV